MFVQNRYAIFVECALPVVSRTRVQEQDLDPLKTQSCLGPLPYPLSAQGQLLHEVGIGSPPPGRSQLQPTMMTILYPVGHPIDLADFQDLRRSRLRIT